ncbi:MAG: ergothioneine biosynthesis protein EgtB [Deltaproteobacteria bacterium]|nr:ergothioneine biosynthesis protein EgtB [Deltaproteobacteria bacterium]
MLDVAESYKSVRRRTEQICEPLLIEDFVIQSMPDVSPPKWHLGHTAWFFERFVLATRLAGFKPFHSSYEFIFNSYYEGAGPRIERAERGLLSRPSVSEICEYRAWVDSKVLEVADSVTDLVLLGLHHERQHQELLLTDIKHILWTNPTKPTYEATVAALPTIAERGRWLPFSGGFAEIGHMPGNGFAFDNEGPRHKTYLEPYRLMSALVTNAEYAEFIKAGGYRNAALWLADGWAQVRANGWRAPLYWQPRAAGWDNFTFAGVRPLQMQEPVAHVSYYEADAYARWKGARLPTEAEWENAAASIGTSLEAGLWQWTMSGYGPYHGFRPLPGALGEYNGKFMCNQMVLRGCSWATPPESARTTYRNFFQPQARWQFSGIRLAQ